MINPVQIVEYPIPKSDLDFSDLKELKFPEFIPIEELFLQWLTARIILENNKLNLSPKFIYLEKCSATLIFDDLNNLISLTPIEDHSNMISLINEYLTFILSIYNFILADKYTFINQPQDNILLHKMNTNLSSLEYHLKAQTNLTFEKIFKHFLGICSINFIVKGEIHVENY